MSATPKAPSVQHSKTFCEGYGNFTIESSDGILFHLSHFLLAYASPVFQDMLDIGTRPKNADMGNQTQKVKVTESSVTIDLLLRYIDPKQVPMSLNEDTIGDLLEAARKYQIPSIMAWFESEAGLIRIQETSRTQLSLSQQSSSILFRNPTLVLSLAAKYELAELAKRALLCRVNQGPMGEADNILNAGLYRRIVHLKQERTKVLMEAIRAMAKYDLDKGRDSSISGADEEKLRCRSCSYKRCEWILDLVARTQEKPTWGSLKSGLIRNSNCPPFAQCKSWCIQVSHISERYKVKLEKIESKLPSL
jgi:hypothetical protein